MTTSLNEIASATSVEPAQRRRIKEMEVMVADAIPETADTTTLLLFTGNDRLDYAPGHFLTVDPHQFEGLERFIAFLEDLKGKREPPRAYSLSSAPHQRYLAITVKEERYVSSVTKYPPLLSPLLVKRLTRGTRLLITGFTGPYTMPPDVESRTEHLVHVCAGSGIVPNYSIIKEALVACPRLRHTLVYSNRTWEDIIFWRQIDELAMQHPERLRVIYTLTREPEADRYGPHVRPGRVNAAILREAIPDPSACLVYACGPAISAWDRAAAKAKGTAPEPRFLESVLGALTEIGVPKSNIRHESYG